MRFRPPRWTVVLGLLTPLVTGGCSDSTAPSKQPDELTIITLLSSAPPLVANTVSLEACQGQGAEGRLFFQGAGGEGEEFARLTLDGESLRLKPDGTPFAPGECVTISMTVPDPTRLLVQLEPTGLRFDPTHPAKLRLDYGEAEGVDSDIESRMAIWRQESTGDPFVRIGTAVFKDSREVEASLFGFSRYALAY